jgi:sulfate adenylyltransferase
MALVNPHGGGDLNPLLLEGKALKDEQERSKKLTKIKVSSREKGDIIMFGIGGFTPLNGFMTHADWAGVCDGMKSRQWFVLAYSDYTFGGQGDC